jgi:hypothetical protein
MASLGSLEQSSSAVSKFAFTSAPLSSSAVTARGRPGARFPKLVIKFLLEVWAKATLEMNARLSKTVKERFNFMKLLRAFGLRRLDDTFNHVLVFGRKNGPKELT